MIRPKSHDIELMGDEIIITLTAENEKLEFVFSVSDAMALSADIERVANED